MNTIEHIFAFHLEQACPTFGKYCPPEGDVLLGNMWIILPFTELENHNLNSYEQEQLIELSSDIELKVLFASMLITQFWIKVRNDFPILHEKEMRVLPVFSTLIHVNLHFQH